MAIFGLGGKTKTKKTASKKASAKSKKAGGRSSADAKAVLKKMQAKQDAGDCAFC